MRCSPAALPGIELETAAGVFSLSLGPEPLLGEVGLTGEGAARGAEEGPAVASSAVMRRLRSRSMGVPGPCLGAAAYTSGPPIYGDMGSCMHFAFA